MKKGRTSKLLLAISIISIVIYTSVAMWIQYCTGYEVSTTLTTCVFVFFGTELISLAGIKITKVKSNYGAELLENVKEVLVEKENE